MHAGFCMIDVECGQVRNRNLQASFKILEGAAKVDASPVMAKCEEAKLGWTSVLSMLIPVVSLVHFELVHF